MTLEQIRNKIRHGLREFAVVTVINDEIDEVALEGVAILGNEIKKVSPSYFNKRKSISSNTHVFPCPSDCLTILSVHDLMTTAKTITGATNAEPIVITSEAHGFSDDDIIAIHDVLGNTEANGTWKVANKDANTLELYGSVGAADYVSGGKIFQESYTFDKIFKTKALGDKTTWYPRGRNIVIGSYSFTNDILLEYAAMPDSVDDIPVEYHRGIVAFGVMSLIQMPDEGSKTTTNITQSLNTHTTIWGLIVNQIKSGMKASIEPTAISQAVSWDEGFC